MKKPFKKAEKWYRAKALGFSLPGSIFIFIGLLFFIIADYYSSLYIFLLGLSLVLAGICFFWVGSNMFDFFKKK